MSSRRALLACGLVLAVGTAAAPAQAAEDPVFTRPFSSVAIRGTDPVAYFSEERPVEGSRDFAFDWRGATWRFSSQANLDAFEADPERYAPQYGGYCAWAVANGYTASTDPEAWTIYEGKLYLNYSLSVQAQWEEDIPGNVQRADQNWPGVLER